MAQEKYEDKKEDKDYACTKLSILKRMLRLKIQSIQNERFKKCSQKKFVVSFMRLKVYNKSSMDFSDLLKNSRSRKIKNSKNFAERTFESTIGLFVSFGRKKKDTGTRSFEIC